MLKAFSSNVDDEARLYDVRFADFRLSHRADFPLAADRSEIGVRRLVCAGAGGVCPDVVGVSVQVSAGSRDLETVFVRWELGWCQGDVKRGRA